jgi:nucleotide-binding universal stress UspA family protein
VLKTIVIGLDNSGLAEQIMQALQELPLQAATKIVLSHVVSPVEGESDLEADHPHNDFQPLPYRNLEKQLQSYQSALPCPSEIEIVSGDPAEEIVRLAKIHQADLIMIGSRGLTGLNRIISGSVSSQVIESAPCSVWVVKSKS